MITLFYENYTYFYHHNFRLIVLNNYESIQLTFLERRTNITPIGIAETGCELDVICDNTFAGVEHLISKYWDF